MKNVYLFVASLLVLFLCSFQHVSAQEFMSMEKMEEQLLQSAQNLKASSTRLQEELSELKQQQAISTARLTDLTQYCENILTALGDCEQQLAIYKEKLQDKKNSLNRLLGICVIGLALFVMVRIAIIILKFHGLQLPYWLNAIL